MRRWEFVLDGQTHRIALAKDQWLLDRPRSVQVDGRQIPIKVGVADVVRSADRDGRLT